MSARINISIGGKWHFYDIVAAAYELGALNYFYTTIFFKNRSIVDSFLGRRFHFSNRYSDYFPSSKVMSNWIPELYSKTLQRLKLKSDGEALRIRCELFDDWTSKVMDDCSVFHSQDGFCLKTARKMKEKGAIFICDRGIISASYLRNLSEREYSRYGINKEYADCYIMDRTHLEHLLADCILVPTETVKKSLVEEGIEERKIAIVPYGVDLDLFNVTARARDKFNVIFVGELSFRKGCHYLLNAWKNLRFKDARLTMIGHVEKEFRSFLSKEDWPNVAVVPYVTQQELLEYYKDSTLFVLPSLAEGSARVIYEAMACSLPVLYTDMSGSIARNNIDGFEIPAFNRLALEERLEYCYLHRDEIAIMGNNGHKWVRNYSKENYRKKIQAIYSRYLNNI